MNKKVIIGIVAVILVLCIALGIFFIFNNRALDTDNSSNTNNNNNNANETIPNESQDEDIEDNTDDTTSDTGNVLVVYFSAQGHTEDVANQIAENLNADIFVIEPADPYTNEDLNYTDSDSRVTREYEDESLRDVELVTTIVPNWDNYETVLIGYPIWWGVAAWPVNTFVEANDFSGKTVIPFCTSASSGLGQSGELLAETAGTGNWLEGYRFRSNPTDSDIEEFINSLN